jgi:hypothetical protein
MVSDDPEIRLFSSVIGSSRIPSSAYQKWAKKELKIFKREVVSTHSNLTRPI